MARRSRKSGRFSKTRTRRRTRKKFSIGQAAQTALIANAATTGLFGTNLMEFVTGKGTSGGFGGDGSNNSWEITIPELFSLATGGTGGMHVAGGTWGVTKGLPDAIRKNLRDNGMMALGQIIAVPIIFKMGRKILAKPLINPTNRLLKQTGIDVKL